MESKGHPRINFQQPLSSEAQYTQVVSSAKTSSLGDNSPSRYGPSSAVSEVDITRSPSSTTRRLPARHASLPQIMNKPSYVAAHDTVLSNSNAQSSPSHSLSSPEANIASPKPRKSVSRSISQLFKNLFHRKSHTKESVDDDDHNPKQSNEGKAATGSYRSSVSFSPLTRIPSTVAQSLAQHKQTAPGGHSTADDVAAAMRRAASITGRQHAPTTLLAVSSDLPPKMARNTWCIRDYSIIEKLYTGYASNVYKATCKHSGELVCLKSYAITHVCELNRYQIFREIKLHSSLSHEHIIKLYGAFQQADQVVLVQEFADAGDLFSLLHKYGGRLPERTAVELVLYPFLCVLNYLHQNGIVHRDIKPENLLINSQMRLKLCDFGLAINLREERAVTRAGTLEYMAPEVLNCPYKNHPDENKDDSSLYYSTGVDTWAVGVLAYEIIVGMPPFNDKQRAMIEGKIREENPRFPSKTSELARDFIMQALHKDPLERPNVMEMLSHKWIRAHRRSSSVRNLQPQASRSHGSQSGGRPMPPGLMSDDPIEEEEEEVERTTAGRGANGRVMKSAKSFTAGAVPQRDCNLSVAMSSPSMSSKLRAGALPSPLGKSASHMQRVDYDGM